MNEVHNNLKIIIGFKYGLDIYYTFIINFL